MVNIIYTYRNIYIYKIIDYESMKDEDVRIISNLFDVIGDKLLKTTELLLHKYGNLTIAEANAVYAVGPLGSKTMKQIAETLGVAVSTPTRTIDRLLDKELASRKVDPNDRRKLLIELTPKGKELLAEMDEEGMIMVAKMLEHLKDEEIESLKKILLKIAENL
jgi:DNA-binding MarR family transcriptional regulator